MSFDPDDSQNDLDPEQVRDADTDRHRYGVYGNDPFIAELVRDADRDNDRSQRGAPTVACFVN
jgi:hypothetical protein